MISDNGMGEGKGENEKQRVRELAGEHEREKRGASPRELEEEPLPVLETQPSEMQSAEEGRGE